MKKIKINIIEAVKFFKENVLSITEVSKRFNMERHTLSKYLGNLPKTENYIDKDGYRYYFEENEWNALEHYKQTGRLVESYTKYGVAKNTFIRWKDLFELSQYKQYKYNYDRNKFQTIETEEDAYWLGFITADGYLNEDRGFLSIKLQASDENHLQKFLNFLNAKEVQIKDDKGGSGQIVKVVTLNSRELINNLTKYGLEQGKSGKEKYISLPLCLQKHYIRGLIDGDGCLHDGDIPMFDLVGSKELVQNVVNFINENIVDLELNKHGRVYSHGTIYRMRLNKKETVYKCFQYFYESANIYLDRKYNYAMSFLHGRDKTEEKTGTA